MKTLCLFVSLVIVGSISISARKDLKDLGSDQTFIKSVALISSLPTNFQTETQAQLNEEFKKLANSIALLKENYPDLNSPGAADILITKAMDKLANENKAIIHGDTCLRDLIKAIFTCFCTSGPRETVNACLATACASYKACKEGGNR